MDKKLFASFLVLGLVTSNSEGQFSENARAINLSGMNSRSLTTNEVQVENALASFKAPKVGQQESIANSPEASLAQNLAKQQTLISDVSTVSTPTQVKPVGAFFGAESMKALPTQAPVSILAPVGGVSTIFEATQVRSVGAFFGADSVKALPTQAPVNILAPVGYVPTVLESTQVRPVGAFWGADSTKALPTQSPIKVQTPISDVPLPEKLPI